MKKTRRIQVGERVLVDGQGTGKVIQWSQFPNYEGTHTVLLDTDVVVSQLTYDTMVPLKNVSIEAASARFATLKALREEIAATKLTLRNLKSALVLIEGA